MINLTEKQLAKAIRPMFIEAWNANNEQKIYDVKIYFAYFPKEYDGGNPPRIRYDIILENGQTTDRFHCDKIFVGIIDCITTIAYERMMGLD
tara:strand:- start:1968 stop:2243 length:276 start_codon:yes stop_codon:yes gene_type:complete